MKKFLMILTFVGVAILSSSQRSESTIFEKIDYLKSLWYEDDSNKDSSKIDEELDVLLNAYDIIKDTESYSEMVSLVEGTVHKLDKKISKALAEVVDNYVIEDLIQLYEYKLEECSTAHCKSSINDILKSLYERRALIEKSNCRLPGNFKKAHGNDLKYREVLRHYTENGYERYNERAFELKVPTLRALIEQFETVSKSEYIEDSSTLEQIEKFANALACCGESPQERTIGDVNRECRSLVRISNQIGDLLVEKINRNEDDWDF